MTKDEFIIECNKIGVVITDEILEKLELYKDLLIEWNKKFNLTTITLDKDIYLKHFYDSIYLLTSSDFHNKEILDFGTGAGFPGMVLAILLNDSNITLMESNGKKVTFLNEVKNKLSLNNVNIICVRAEDYGKKHREKFDVITCRAVSNLNIILELSTSMLKVGGLFIPMKSNIDEELENAKDNISKFSYSLIDKKEYHLPIENSIRNILIFKKINKTDIKYPRNYNIIKKQNV